MKSLILFDSMKMYHEIELELNIPAVEYCDVINRTTWIQYEIDGHWSPKVRSEKTKKYLRLGIKDVVIGQIRTHITDINEIRSFVMDYLN